jgi:hypothetical protein
MEWQPIETAPKIDEKQIIIYNGDAVQSGYWHEDYGWVSSIETSSGFNYANIIDNPTHWMPLPAPPTQKAPTD